MPEINALGRLGRGPRADRDGMDISLHHVSECRVHAPVPRQRSQPCKGFADDLHGKMTAPVARAFVAGMLVAIVLHIHACRKQGLQGGADSLGPHGVVSHGSTTRKGFTSTLAYTPAAR